MSPEIPMCGHPYFLLDYRLYCYESIFISVVVFMYFVLCLIPCRRLALCYNGAFRGYWEFKTRFAVVRVFRMLSLHNIPRPSRFMAGHLPEMKNVLLRIILNSIKYTQLHILNVNQSYYVVRFYLNRR